MPLVHLFACITEAYKASYIATFTRHLAVIVASFGSDGEVQNTPLKIETMKMERGRS